MYDDDPENPNIIHTALEAGKLLAGASIIAAQKDDGTKVHYHKYPDGRLEIAEELLDRPIRRRGIETFKTVDGFVKRVDPFLVGGHTVLFRCDEASGSLSISATLNAQTPDAPGFSDAVIRLEGKHQPELLFWLHKNGQWVSQDDFIDLLTERAHEIVAPQSAEILEIVQDLTASEGGEYKAFRRHTSSEGHTVFRAAVSGTDGAEIPQRITIGLPVWQRGVPHQFTLLVKATVKDSKPVFRLKLQDPDSVIEGATTALLALVEESLHGEAKILR